MYIVHDTTGTVLYSYHIWQLLDLSLAYNYTSNFLHCRHVMMSGCNTGDLNAYNWKGVGGWVHGEEEGRWTHGEGDIEGGCRRVGTWRGEHTSM